MTYDSPKTLRNRQQRQNDAQKRKTQQRTVKVSSDELWDRTCDFHLKQIEAHGRANHHGALVRQVQAMVQGAIYRRACQIMPKYKRSYLAVVEIARIELLGKEPL